MLVKNVLITRFIWRVTVTFLLALLASALIVPGISGKPNSQATDQIIALKSAHNTYVSANWPEAGGDVNNNATRIGPVEKFTIVPLTGGQIALRTAHNTYVSANWPEVGGDVNNNATQIGPVEKFTMVLLTGNKIALKTAHNTYISANWPESGGDVNNNPTQIGPVEQFTIVDLAKPRFPIEAHQHTTVRNNRYMESWVQITDNGKLYVNTNTWSDHLEGFTGGVTVVLFDAKRQRIWPPNDTYIETYGVNGKLLPGNDRWDDWYYDISINTLNEVDHIAIYHTYEPKYRIWDMIEDVRTAYDKLKPIIQDVAQATAASG